LLGEAGKKIMLFWRVAVIGLLVQFCISEWEKLDLYVLRKQAMTSQDVLSFNISIISFRQQRTMLARSNSHSKGKEADRALSSFISRDPKSKYTFDSERGSSQSELCREGGEKGKECIMLQMNAKRLFEAMQENGFYCALPMDPSQTFLECTPIPQM